jgi:hypothetical protein
MKLFYTGPAVNTEMLAAMLEKHGIESRVELSEGADPEDLSAESKVFVPEESYDLAHRLFYTEREDEL